MNWSVGVRPIFWWYYTPDVFFGGRLCNLDICGQYVTNIIYYINI